MKAIAIIPRKANSIHLREVPKPSVGYVEGGPGVLVKVLQVGVDGTDKEINAGEYGDAPPGEEYLVIGHESFGPRSRSLRRAISSWRPCADPANPSTTGSVCTT
jgi:threonine dehydrogenase-like Zn-dependent dehydrogenase